MKIDVRCGVSDGGKPCRRNIGQIQRDGFPDLWFRDGNYEGRGGRNGTTPAPSTERCRFTTKTCCTGR